MSAPEPDHTAGAGPRGGGGAMHADDPLARIGRQLVGAAAARRRRRRHAQRAAGALVTVAVLAGTALAVQPFAGAPEMPAGGQRVELDAGDGRFTVRTDGGQLCADRPNGRDREGTTICAFPDLVRDQLAQPGRAAWLQARVVGDRVVVTGLAAADALVVVRAPPPGGVMGAIAESRPGGPAVTVTLSREGEPQSQARPFVLTVPRTGAAHVLVLVPGARGRALLQHVPIGAAAPPGLGGFVQLRYAVSAAARVAEAAQQRLQGAGVARAQVVGDGDRLTAWVTGPQAEKARAALMPGVVTAYDWEASVTPATAEPLADAQRRLRRQQGPAQLVQALGPRGSLPARRDPRARFHVLRGRPALTDTPRLGMRPPPRGGSGEPAWQLDFGAAERDALHRLTRRVAQRGQALMTPGVTASAAAQHVALVLDGRLLTVLAIDPARLPDGVSGGVLELPPSFATSGAVRQAGVLERGPLPPLRALP